MTWPIVRFSFNFTSLLFLVGNTQLLTLGPVFLNVVGSNLPCGEKLAPQTLLT